MEAPVSGKMTRDKVTIIDYGMGNIGSVNGALQFLGAAAEITPDPECVRKASSLILPGVGSFRKAMEKLTATGLSQAISDAVLKRGRPILGICLGMQLMGSASTEDGEADGLGLVPNRVTRFTREETPELKIPHVGFNTVRFSESDGLFKGLSDGADFYFVHSYRMLEDGLSGRKALCDHGGVFLAGFQTGQRICGTQFHPEKSQTNGLILLKNYLDITRSC